MNLKHTSLVILLVASILVDAMNIEFTPALPLIDTESTESSEEYRPNEEYQEVLDKPFAFSSSFEQDLLDSFKQKQNYGESSMEKDED